MEIDVPICVVCKHAHEQGVRCSECGHVGKSNLYPKMLARATAASSFNVVCFCAQSTHVPHLDHQFNVTMAMRRSVFGEEHGDAMDAEAHHASGLLGNAPVMVARWRLVQFPETWISRPMSYALVDRLGVLPDYRRRGFGKRALQELCNNVMLNRATGIAGVVVLVPAAEAWAVNRLMENGFEVMDASIAGVSDVGLPGTVALVLSLGCLGNTPVV